MTVITNISKVLLEITGDPRPESAILELLPDAIEHRIEKIQAELKRLEQKYNMGFEEFKDKFHKKAMPDSYSYEIETDYLEWEGLISRLSKYKSLLTSIL